MTTDSWPNDRVIAVSTKYCFDQMSVGQMSISQMSAGRMSADQMSIGQMCVCQMPLGQMPFGQMPFGQMPVAQMAFDKKRVTYKMLKIPTLDQIFKTYSAVIYKLLK